MAAVTALSARIGHHNRLIGYAAVTSLRPGSTRVPFDAPGFGNDRVAWRQACSAHLPSGGHAAPLRSPVCSPASSLTTGAVAVAISSPSSEPRGAEPIAPEQSLPPAQTSEGPNSAAQDQPAAPEQPEQSPPEGAERIGPDQPLTSDPSAGPQAQLVARRCNLFGYRSAQGASAMEHRAVTICTFPAAVYVEECPEILSIAGVWTRLYSYCRDNLSIATVFLEARATKSCQPGRRYRTYAENFVPLSSRPIVTGYTSAATCRA